jgi:hypothetical protein
MHYLEAIRKGHRTAAGRVFPTLTKRGYGVLPQLGVGRNKRIVVVGI